MSEAAARDLYAKLLDAWNRRDARLMASLCLPRGVYIGFDGSVMRGPAAIEAALAPIFRDHPTARYVSIVESVELFEQGFAVVSAVAGMLPPGERRLKEDRTAIQTLVAAQEIGGPRGGWGVALFQNTPAAFDGRSEQKRTLVARLQAEADEQ